MPSPTIIRVWRSPSGCWKRSTASPPCACAWGRRSPSASSSATPSAPRRCSFPSRPPTRTITHPTSSSGFSVSTTGSRLGSAIGSCWARREWPDSAPGSAPRCTFLFGLLLARPCQPFTDRILHGEEGSIHLQKPGDQLLQNKHPVPAADHKRMESVGEDTPILDDPRHVQKLVRPVLQHAAGVHQPLEDIARGPKELEMRVVVQAPADGHFHQLRGLP